MSGLRLASLNPQTNRSRIREFIEGLESYDPLPTEPTAKHLSFHQQSQYLHVSDLEFDEHGNAKRVEILQHDTIHSPLRQRSPDELRIDIENALSTLPAQPRGGIRIYLAQNCHPTISEPHSGEGDAIRRSSVGPGRKGYHGLSTQWRAPVPETCFESTSFLLDSGIALGLHGLMRSTKPGLMNSTKRVYTLETSDSGVIFVICSETYESPGFFGMRIITDDDERAAMAATSSFGLFVIDFRELQDIYEPLLWGAKTCKRRKQILLLWFNHAQLLQTLQNFEQVRMMYHGLIESRVVSRRSELGPKLLDESITETNIFKNFEGTAEELSSALESLLDIIKAGYEDTSGDPKGIITIAADLQGLVSDLGRKAGEMPRLSAHHLKSLEMRRSMQGSDDLYSLSVIASIFLPMSLACGILSMQTRLMDLHYLLYDFCGVVVILATLILLFSSMNEFNRFMLENLPEPKLPLNKSVKIQAVLLLMTTLGAWAVILVSFVVGMTTKVRLGGLILGYGMAAVIGVGGIAFYVIAVGQMTSNILGDRQARRMRD